MSSTRIMYEGYGSEEETFLDVTFLDVEKVEDIKENELFGIIVSKYDMKTVYPDINFYKDGNISYDFGIDEEYIAEQVHMDEFGAVIGGEDVPLIMRKLNDNLAQEILSGEVFLIKGSSNKLFSDDNGIYTGNDNYSIESFQEKDNKFKLSNVILTCQAIKWTPVKTSQECLENAFFVVDDYFKKIYHDDTLSRKDDVVEALKYIKSQAKAVYDDEYKKSIDSIQAVANTDNLLYDMEKQSHGQKM